MDDCGSRVLDRVRAGTALHHLESENARRVEASPTGRSLHSVPSGASDLDSACNGYGVVRSRAFGRESAQARAVFCTKRLCFTIEVSWAGPLNMPELTRITRDSRVMGGKPCIRGMRVTVGTVVGLVAAGRTREEILRDYPYLEAEDIAEALSYAAWRAGEVEVPLRQP